MAVQQRRNSKTRKAKRRTHYKLTAPTMVKLLMDALNYHIVLALAMLITNF